MYENDDDGRFPAGVDAVDRAYPSLWQSFPDWEARIGSMPLLNDLLLPYTRSKAVFVCPSDTGMEYIDIDFPLKLNAEPSLAAVYGSSYFYRTEITFRQLSDSDFQLPAQVGVMVDGAGNWHGGARALSDQDVGDLASILGIEQAYRYNLLFGDFHAKFVNIDVYRTAWTTGL